MGTAASPVVLVPDAIASRGPCAVCRIAVGRPRIPRIFTVRWTVLIPVKSLPEAKSRLTGASADPAAHARLVRAIRADTVAAAREADGVARLVLVLDGPAADLAPGGLTFVQTVPGLNAALAEAADDARRRWPQDAVAALVGDLPALRSTDLAAALAAAATHEHAYVPDASGTGTTLLTAAPGAALRPRFGAGSAHRHAEVAAALDAAAGLRRDVDTGADLHLAAALGVGPATRAELERAERAQLDTTG
jgi:2-phospho-L-lactate guanylyltransferase